MNEFRIGPMNGLGWGVLEVPEAIWAMPVNDARAKCREFLESQFPRHWANRIVLCHAMEVGKTVMFKIETAE